MASSRSNTRRTFAPQIITVALLCAVATALPWSILDSARMVYLSFREAQQLTFFATAFILYALPSIALGLVAGLLALPLRPWLTRFGQGDPVTGAIVILLPGMFFGWGALLALGYANFYLLPLALHPISLAGDAGILALAGILWALSTRRLLKRDISARPKMRAWGRWLGLAALVLLVASFALVRAADRPGNHSRVVHPAVNPEKQAQPNILLISIDTLRSDHMSIYGYARDTTPFIDALAQEGVLFRNSRSQSAWTRSSAASLITSLHPSSHGALYQNSTIRDDVITLFEYLKLRGYQTALFSANGNVSPTFGFSQGVDVVYHSSAHSLPKMLLFYRTLVRVGIPANVLLKTIWRQAFVDLDDRAARDLWVVERFQEWIAALETEPFVAYIHLIGVHAPYLPPHPYDGAFGSPERTSESERIPQNPGTMMAPGEQISELIRSEMIDRYDGLARFSDAQVKVAMEAVRRKGLLDSTVVIVTADHGEALGDHRMWGHNRSLYEELVRVPLVLWAGEELRERIGRVPRVTDLPVSTIDVMPTLLSLVGMRCPSCEGENLIELAEQENRRRPIFMEQHSQFPDPFSIYATQDSRYKLIHAEFPDSNWETWELYDLAADPAEANNLLQGQPDETFPLFREMMAYRETAPGRQSDPSDVDLEKHPELLEELKALGYVN